ncbi:hypothetical protein INS49_003047 [Diaporthe citri]|uniref:uncharacterized protein n=1 Tax=Diaporthe citri TaxID=83186 RepID=UPI001C7FBDC2|nr:uncharacterized protein INS49_003047 [Diaporthe citri]KAG6368831.1 hypothetical protein INS49_003047 [Diaporthe citri]
MADRQPHQIPRWVIDTHNGCIIPGASVPRYACLSYTWSQPLISVKGEGSSSGSSRLNSETLADFQQPGFLNSKLTDRVPAVLRDAMDLVSGAGERYLWIDCFCILQGSDSTRAEFDRMDDIYAGAHVTIIAAAAEGLRGGTTYGNLGRKWHYRHQEMHHKMIKTTWASRGWTFQEHLLSKRTIVFLGNGQTFWDCNTDIWHQDTTQQELETGRSPSFGWAFSQSDACGPNLSRLNWPDMELYTRIICLFNTRKFSFPQDCQAAFSGVLHSFSRAFFGGFINALPRLFLDAALLWQPCKGYMWSVMSNHGDHGDIIREPAMLQKYRSYLPDTTDALPNGWRINISNVAQRRWFSHDAIQPKDHMFAYPVPLPESENDEAHSFNTSWPFLTGSTTSVNLRVRYILTPDRMTVEENFDTDGTAAILGLDVTELPEFTAGPDDCFSVAALEDEHGTWAGVLRVAETCEAGKEKESLRPGDKAELISLSRGQVPCRILLDEYDTNDLSEEQIDNRGWVEFNSNEVNQGQEVNQGTYTKSRIRFRREGGLDKDDQGYKCGKSAYEIYNVM